MRFLLFHVKSIGGLRLNTEAVSLKIDANVHFFLRTMGDPDVKDAIMQELVHQMLDS